jgi:uncharacterized protein (DUF1778 family)
MSGSSPKTTVLSIGRRAAEDALLDQILFKVSQETYDQFVARLDAAPAPSEKLRRTISARAPWD